MRKNFLLNCVTVCFILILNFDVLAQQQCDQAPPAGSALIIYNSAYPSQYDFSLPSMQVFRAALSGDISHIQNLPNFPANPIQGGIPLIDPPLLSVNILDVTNVGMERNLREKFYRRGNAIIDGMPFLGDVFDEFYDEGNPLAYWSQVYDLRFIHQDWDANLQRNSVITTTGQRNDLEYFRQFMRDGGSLYVQTIRSAHETRSRSVESVIRALTLDNYDRTRGNAGRNVSGANIRFNSTAEAEYFATCWNNLTTLQQQHPMTWIQAGGYILGASDHAIPLVTDETNRAMMMMWNRNGLAPDVQNGRLVVGFAITAWGDHFGPGSDGATGRVTRTTMAVIQNLYGRMSMPDRYSLAKRFVEPDIGLGEEGNLEITIRNPNTFPILGNVTGDIIDTLSKCLVFIEGSSRVGGVAVAPRMPIPLTADGRQILIWSADNINVPARGNLLIEFRYRAIGLPPSCENQ